MDKPKPVVLDPALDWGECKRYIQDELGVNIEDYAGKFAKGNSDPNTPYQDFWGYICNYDPPANGSFFFISDDEYTISQMEEWQIEIISILFFEFYEYLDADGLRFWVDW